MISPSFLCDWGTMWLSSKSIDKRRSYFRHWFLTWFMSVNSMPSSWIYILNLPASLSSKMWFKSIFKEASTVTEKSSKMKVKHFPLYHVLTSYDKHDIIQTFVKHSNMCTSYLEVLVLVQPLRLFFIFNQYCISNNLLERIRWQIEQIGWAFGGDGPLWYSLIGRSKLENVPRFSG